MFGKRISELTSNDIQRIVDESVPEGSEVEYKETLPAKSGSDPWVTGKNEIGDKARNELLEEVIAFANAYGGVLVLGIAEAHTKPPRADKISPLPRCIELADRLRLQCRDCIEPQIPLLEVRGIPTQDDGSGIVIFQAPKSRMAPHRHTVTKECYFRRADRSEKMTMREIQDLTLQVVRGLEGIDNRFNQQKNNCDRIFTNYNNTKNNTGTNYYGLRATVIPLTPLYLDKVHNVRSVRPPFSSFKAVKNSLNFNIDFPVPDARWRPILRGSRGESETENLNNKSIYEIEIFTDGLIEYRGFVIPQGGYNVLPIKRIMSFVCNAMFAVENFRKATSAQNVEFGLELELKNNSLNLQLGDYNGMDRIGRFDIQSYIFPRYSIGPVSEFNKLANLIERDILNAAGEEQYAAIDIDFNQA